MTVSLWRRWTGAARPRVPGKSVPVHGLISVWTAEMSRRWRMQEPGLSHPLVSRPFRLWPASSSAQALRIRLLWLAI